MGSSSPGTGCLAVMVRVSPQAATAGRPLAVYERPRKMATRSPRWLVISVSYTPVRPAFETSKQRAVSTSPSCAGAMKSIEKPEATVSSLYELQAKAKVESAKVAMKPPWQMAWPLSMSWRTCICRVAWPGATSTMRMPRPLLALSLANMPSRTCSAVCCGVREVSVISAILEHRCTLGTKGFDAFAVVGGVAQLALDACFFGECRVQVHVLRRSHGLPRGDQGAGRHCGEFRCE